MKIPAIDLRTALLGTTLLGTVLLTGPIRADASEAGRTADRPASTLPLPAQAGGNYDVDLQGVRFVPEDITVRVGDTVTWTHRDSGLGHHVAADDGLFDSHPTCGRPFGLCMKGGDRFSYTFRESGVYGYHCRPHGSPGQGMAGTVTVVRSG